MQASDAARNGVLVRAAELDTLVVSGPDRLSWLNGLVTCDVAGLAPGQGRWGLVLNKQGKVQSEVQIVGTADAAFVGWPSGSVADSLPDYLERYLIMEDAEIRAAGTDYAWITLHGPKAAAAAPTVPGVVAWGAIDWTGLGGAALVVPASGLAEALAFLLREPDAVLASPGDWERLRVERLLPELGRDYQVSDNPHDASLERRAVSWTKGCYLGQEVVCMQDMRGKLKRRIVTVVLDHGAPPEAGSVVLASDGQTAGELTTSVFSEQLGKPVALARLGAAFSQPGTALRVGDVPAWILDQPA